MKIRVLDRETAEKIAAGEVIERPASVVKELLDNSIDSGATRITVEIIAGGKKLIKVSDNGSGISFEDLPLAFLRHATSKLTTLEDLETITTLGFRGEALPSIAAVSKVHLISKPDQQFAGGEIVFEAGKALLHQETAARNGTTITIEDLFFNTPARLKFLKTDSHEASLIGELVSEYALGNTNISFEYISDNKTLLRTTGKSNIKETLAEVWGRQTSAALAEQQLSIEDITIKGYFSPFELHRSSRKQQIFFVNNRLVKNVMLQSALEEPYKGVLPYKKHPIGLIYINLPQEQTDINVHPAKTLIKFHDERKVFYAIKTAAANTLLSPNTIKTEPLSIAEPPKNDIKETKNNLIQQSFNTFSQYQEKPYQQFQKALPYLQPSSPEIVKEQAVKLFPRLRFLANYKKGYLLTEAEDGLYIIDQHAAHERILYEKILNSLDNTPQYSQILMEPVVVELPVKGSNLAEDILVELKQIGFEIDHFGDSSYIIRSAPVFLNGVNLAEEFLAIINDIDTGSKRRISLAANIACKAAVKLTESLSPQENEKLIKDLACCEEPFRCPHGRPVLVEISDNQLQKWFKRTL